MIMTAAFCYVVTLLGALLWSLGFLGLDGVFGGKLDAS
jgi:hypothetical protein